MTEFTPAEDGKWIGYGLTSGAVPVFRVTISPGDIKPVFEDSVPVAGPGAVTGLDVCQKPIADLSKDDLVKCAQGYVEALGSKQQ